MNHAIVFHKINPVITINAKAKDRLVFGNNY